MIFLGILNSSSIELLCVYYRPVVLVKASYIVERSEVRTASLQFARPEAGLRTQPTEAGSRKISEKFYRDQVPHYLGRH